ncbi:50S ribosomal L2 [Micractinium conductrix]|uniref:Large ribosomal subunit protein uL2m n=1 Tax=Micractinium conductrix TaxID=554055 RepID=A0A2P6VHD2_9CHLO|nr:50S ribosomal L2 [Micractinium conductrix]|eukprot:PSC73499.1 50S ribosomal L2 [Micractinium conductrix]
MQRLARAISAGLRSTQQTQSVSDRLVAAFDVQGPSTLWAQLQQRLKSSNSSGLKVYKPTTPGFRGRVITSRKDLWKGGPFKPLTMGLSRTGGRNAHGVITSRHRGGGHRKVYRVIDFARSGGSGSAVVQRLEYDPNRSARIALVKHKGVADDAPLRSQYSYILAPQDVKEGDTLFTGGDAPIRPGNTLPLSAIPVGMAVHNVELRPGAGGQLARAAGASCTLIKKGDDGYSVLKMPSGEQRLVLSRCTATIGVLSNPQHKNIKLGKAGATRWAGRRPRVRGMAMNTVDHPHGGGRGKKKGRISQTPWGKPTKGYRTRSNKRTDWAIRLSRHKAVWPLLPGPPGSSVASPRLYWLALGIAFSGGLAAADTVLLCAALPASMQAGEACRLLRAAAPDAVLVALTAAASDGRPGPSSHGIVVSEPFPACSTSSSGSRVPHSVCLRITASSSPAAALLASPVVRLPAPWPADQPPAQLVRQPTEQLAYLTGAPPSIPEGPLSAELRRRFPGILRARRDTVGGLASERFVLALAPGAAVPHHISFDTQERAPVAPARQPPSPRTARQQKRRADQLAKERRLQQQRKQQQPAQTVRAPIQVKPQNGKLPPTRAVATPPRQAMAATAAEAAALRRRRYKRAQQRAAKKTASKAAAAAAAAQPGQEATSPATGAAATVATAALTPAAAAAAATQAAASAPAPTASAAAGVTKAAAAVATAAEGAPEEADSVVAGSGSAHPADTRSQARRDPPQASAGQGGDEAEREEETAAAELAEAAAEAELAVGSCEHTPPDSPRAPPQRSLAEVVAGLPGSPVHLLHQRLDLPLPPMPDPCTFEEEDWLRQGCEVRSVIAHRQVGERLFVRVVWEDSWEPAEALVGPELEQYQRSRGADADTDVVGWAQQRQQEEAAAEEAEEEASAAAQGSGAAGSGRPRGSAAARGRRDGPQQAAAGGAAAYDRVPRAQLWQRLESMGYGGQWLRAVRALYADVPMSVTAPGLEGRVFSATQGLKQGCPLSPTLFSLYIADWEERVLSAAAAGMPLALPQLAGQPVPPLLYADDMALLATTANGLQQQLRLLEQYCAERGLTVNVVKTKVMLLSGAADEQTAMQRVRRARHTFDGAPVAGVAAFKYLGLVFHCTQPVGEAAAEGRARVARFAAASFEGRCTALGLEAARLLLSLYRQMVDSTLSYGAAVWSPGLALAAVRRLGTQAGAAGGGSGLSAAEQQHYRTLRRLLGLPQRAPRATVLAETGEPPLHAHWLARTARFWNSLVAAPEDSLMRQVLDASLQLAADHTPSRHRGPHGIAQMPWAAQLQSALAEAGIAADLQQRQPLQPEAVQEAALQHYLQHLHTAVQRRGASRLQHYFDCVRPECLEVAGYGMAPYLVEVRELLVSEELAVADHSGLVMRIEAASGSPPAATTLGLDPCFLRFPRCPAPARVEAAAAELQWAWPAIEALAEAAQRADTPAATESLARLRDAMEAAFTAEEVASLARRTAQRKAVFGPLAPWLLKQACAQLAPLAAAEFNAWQRIGRLPRGDAHSAIALVAKTSSPTQPSDLRGIAVGALLAKLFAAGLERRVTAHAEAAGLHAEGQFGFRRQRSTEQAALALRTVIECHRQQRQCGGSSTRSEQPQRRHTRRRRQRGGSQLWACFVDFKQAYDRVPRAQLWQRLESMGYGGQWLRAVRALYADVPMSVTAPGLEGRVFSATQGLKQGCPLSPTLFSLYIADWEERVLSAAAAGMPLALPQLAGQPVPPLLYADDMALLATTANGLQQQLRLLEQYCAERGLTVNVVKTKVMLLSGAADEQTAMQRVRRARHTFDGAPVAGVAAFKYLGLVFHCTQPVGEAAAEGRARVARFAAASFEGRCTALGLEAARLLLSLYRQMVDSTLSYGAAVWSPGLALAAVRRFGTQAGAAGGGSGLSAAEQQHYRTLRRLLGLPQRAPRATVLAETGEPPLHAHWLARTARFWNSLVAAPEDSLMRQVLDASLQLAADHTPSRHRGPHGIAQMPWAAQLQSALAEAGIAADLQQRQPLQPEAVQEAALQHYLQHLHTAVQRRGASRLQHYFDCVRPECLEVAGYGMAPYLVEVRELLVSEELAVADHSGLVMRIEAASGSPPAATTLGLDPCFLRFPRCPAPARVEAAAAELQWAWPAIEALAEAAQRADTPAATESLARLRDAMEAAFTAEEVASLARRTAQRKAVFGPLAPWLLKQACAQLAPLAAAEFNAWQRIGRLPRGDAHSAIALVAKTSSPTQPSDLRGIAVGALLAKLFAAGLERRVTAHAEAAGLHAEGQFGFRRQRSTEQAALALRTVIECHRQQRQCGGSSTRSEQPQRRHTRRRRQRGGSQLWACFVDFKQAYDRVPRAQLWQRLESMGYGGQWLRAVRALYADVPMSVTAPGLEGRVFSATQGLKQGCPLSPTLFSLYIADWEERVLSAAAAGMPLALPQLAGQPVPPLLYADDMALLATTANGLQQQLRLLEQYCAERGLTVNVVKTKVMLLSGAADEQTAMQRVRRARHTFDGAPVAGVAAFKYLGLVFHCTQPVGEAAAEGRARVARFAAASFEGRCTALGLEAARLLLSLYRQMVDSTLSYGAAVWSPGLALAAVRRLGTQAGAAGGGSGLSAAEQQHYRTLRRLLGLPQRAPRATVLAETGEPPLHAHWLARTARFWNSLVAAPEDSLMRQVLDASLQLAADHTPSRHRGPHGIAQMPWAAQLQSALAEAGIAADLQQRQPLQPEAVQEAALQHYLQHLHTAVQRRGASRLQHYFDCVRPECLEVAGYGMAPYLVEAGEACRLLRAAAPDAVLVALTAAASDGRPGPSSHGIVVSEPFPACSTSSSGSRVPHSVCLRITASSSPAAALLASPVVRLPAPWPADQPPAQLVRQPTEQLAYLTGAPPSIPEGPLSAELRRRFPGILRARRDTVGGLASERFVLALAPGAAVPHHISFDPSAAAPSRPPAAAPPPPPAAAVFVGGDARSPRCAAYRRRNLRRRVESPLGDAWVPASDGGSTVASSAPPSRPGSLAASDPPSPTAAAPRDPAGIAFSGIAFSASMQAGEACRLLRAAAPDAVLVALTAAASDGRPGPSSHGIVVSEPFPACSTSSSGSRVPHSVCLRITASSSQAAALLASPVVRLPAPWPADQPPAQLVRQPTEQLAYLTGAPPSIPEGPLSAELRRRFPGILRARRDTVGGLASERFVLALAPGAAVPHHISFDAGEACRLLRAAAPDAVLVALTAAASDGRPGPSSHGIVVSEPFPACSTSSSGSRVPHSVCLRITASSSQAAALLASPVVRLPAPWPADQPPAQLVRQPTEQLAYLTGAPPSIPEGPLSAELRRRFPGILRARRDTVGGLASERFVLALAPGAAVPHHISFDPSAAAPSRPPAAAPPPPPAAAVFVGGDARSPRCAAYRRRNLRRRVESPLGDAWVPASDGGNTVASSAPPSRPGSLAASDPPSPTAAAPRDPAGIAFSGGLAAADTVLLCAALPASMQAGEACRLLRAAAPDAVLVALTAAASDGRPGPSSHGIVVSEPFPACSTSSSGSRVPHSVCLRITASSSQAAALLASPVVRLPAPWPADQPPAQLVRQPTEQLAYLTGAPPSIPEGPLSAELRRRFPGILRARRDTVGGLASERFVLALAPGAAVPHHISFDPSAAAPSRPPAAAPPPPPAAAVFVGGDARSPRCAAYRRRNLRRRVESPLGDAWVPASDGGSTVASSAPPSRPGSLAASDPPSPTAAAPRDPAGIAFSGGLAAADTVLLCAALPASMQAGEACRLLRAAAPDAVLVALTAAASDGRPGPSSHGIVVSEPFPACSTSSSGSRVPHSVCLRITASSSPAAALLASPVVRLPAPWPADQPPAQLVRQPTEQLAYLTGAPPSIPEGPLSAELRRRFPGILRARRDTVGGLASERFVLALAPGAAVPHHISFDPSVAAPSRQPAAAPPPPPAAAVLFVGGDARSPGRAAYRRRNLRRRVESPLGGAWVPASDGGSTVASSAPQSRPGSLAASGPPSPPAAAPRDPAGIACSG